jgi:tetratricopeptide (TPR) repeat protein
MDKPSHQADYLQFEPHLAYCDAHLPTASLLYEQGQVLASQGNFSASLEKFQMALRAHPENHEIWVFQSVILIHLEQYVEALASCDRALTLQPESPQAWTLRGIALHRLDRYQEAYSSYEKALGIQRQPWLNPFKQRLKEVWKSLIMKLYFNPQQEP